MQGKKEKLKMKWTKNIEKSAGAVRKKIMHNTIWQQLCLNLSVVKEHFFMPIVHN